MSQLEVSTMRQNRPANITYCRSYAQAEKLDLNLDSPMLKCKLQRIQTSHLLFKRD